MKMTKWLTVVLMTVTLALAGCSKTPKMPKTTQVNGVEVAIPELQQSLSTSQDKEIVRSSGQLAFGLRYQNYAMVQTELAKLAANPSLTEDQKKLVATVAEQMKQVVAKAPTPPAR